MRGEGEVRTEEAVTPISSPLDTLASISEMAPKKWAPSFLNEDTSSIPSKKSALIILNQPFSLGLLWKLWKTSSWKACADGGANRLYDSFSGELQPLRSRFLPDLIKGDFDSIRSEVKEYYSSKMGMRTRPIS